MFKRHSLPDIPPYYLRLARHWRMGAQSSDLIRQRLMQRGVSWEKTLEIINFLDHEDAEAGKISLSRYSHASQSWLARFLSLIVFGVLMLITDNVFNGAFLGCDLMGFSVLSLGLVGLAIYGLESLI